MSEIELSSSDDLTQKIPEIWKDLQRMRTPAQEYGGSLTEEQVSFILKTYPGAKRAARGFILKVSAEQSLHVTRIPPLHSPDLTPEDHIYYPICTRKEVVRLRQIKSPHDYLLWIRAKAIADNPRLLRVIEERRMRWEARGRVWSLTDYYASLNQAPRRYIERLPKAQQRMVRSTPFGFSAVKEANAICMRSLVGDVVTVSEALREFYYFTVICLTGARRGIDPSDYMTAGLIAARIMVGSESQDFDLDPRCAPPPKLEAELRGQVDAMLEFTFGHEFAHKVLGHLDSTTEGNIRLYTHDHEYAADQHAVLSVPDREARRRLADGAYMVLFALQFITEIGNSFSEVPRFSASSTHPSPVERIWSLHKALQHSEFGRQYAIQKDLETIATITGALIARLRELRSDTLTFYGSLYLGGLGGKLQRDRLDF